MKYVDNPENMKKTITFFPKQRALVIFISSPITVLCSAIRGVIQINIGIVSNTLLNYFVELVTNLLSRLAAFALI